MLTDDLPPSGTVSLTLNSLTLTTTTDTTLYVKWTSPNEHLEGFTTGSVKPVLDNVVEGGEEKKEEEGGSEEKSQNGEEEVPQPAQYTFPISHITSSKSFEVTSRACTAFLAGMTTCTVYKQTGEEANEESDEVVGTAKFPLSALVDGETTTSLVIEIIKTVDEEAEAAAKMAEEEAAKEEEKKKDEEKGEEEEGGKEKKEETVSPLSEETSVPPADSISITLTSSPAVADFTSGGITVTFDTGSVSNCPASFAPIVPDDVEPENYEEKLKELLNEEKGKFAYTLEVETCGMVGFGTSIGGGELSWEKDKYDEEEEEEAVEEKEEKDASEEKKADGEEEETPPTKECPFGFYNLTFHTASPAIFLSRQEIRLLKSAVRGDKRLAITLHRTAAAPGAAAVEEEGKKDKKGKGKKGKKEEEVVAATDEAALEEDFKERCISSLDGLMEPGCVEAEIIGGLDCEAFVSVRIMLGGAICLASKEESTEEKEGECMKITIGVAPYHRKPSVKFEKKLTRDMYKEFSTQLDVSIESLVENWASLFLLNESKSSDLTKEEKMKLLLHHLNKSGGYYKIKESLKPCLQRIVTVRDGKAPDLKSPEGHYYVGELF